MKKTALLLALVFGTSLFWPSSSHASGAFRPTDAYQTKTKKDNQTDAQTDKTIWTPATGYRLVIQGIFVTADATQTVFFETGSTEVFPTIYVGANVPVMVGGGFSPCLILAADEPLTYTSSTGGNTSVVVYGYEDQF